MTEKDLYRYQNAKREEERLKRKLDELESRRVSPRSPTAAPTPPDRGGDTTVRVAAEMDRLDHLRAKYDEAVRETNLAELRLEAVRKILTDDRELTVFDALYVDFYDKKTAAKKTHYGLSTVYRIRASILRQIADIPA